MDQQTAIELVRAQLVMLDIPGVHPESISAHSCLIVDIGLDSMTLVQLTVQLEAALEISEFPMQAWVDACQEHGSPLDVVGLADACRRLVGDR